MKDILAPKIPGVYSVPSLSTQPAISVSFLSLRFPASPLRKNKRLELGSSQVNNHSSD
jgi:hypothetical protein